VTDDLAAWRHEQTQRLLDATLASVHSAGGFGWLGSEGALLLDRGRPLWIGCRMVHCLALGHLLGRDDCTAPLDAGLSSLSHEYRDHEHGGWWADADRPGEGRKEAYGHAFVVLASAGATVAGRPGARDLLEDALAVVLQRFWDDEQQMPFESYAVDFTDLEDYRGGNAAMHLVEAFLAAADATGDQAWLQRASAICTRMVDVAADRGWRMAEHFDAAWGVLPDYNRDEPAHPFRPYGATPGHAFEWARLLLALRAAYPAAPPELSAAASHLVTTAAADAWDESRGGFVYTTDHDGHPVVRERFHWVACEAVGATWALEAATGDAGWGTRGTAYWDWIRRHCATPPLGWQHEFDPDNRPVQRTWVGRPDTYHALQAVLFHETTIDRTLTRSLAES
jgi:sulfoquinovose isomerase